MRKKIVVILLFGISLSLVGMEEVELYPRLDDEPVYHERNPIDINDETAPLISSKVDKVKPSLTRRCLRAACGLSSSSPKRCFWTCCGAITCAGGIIGAIAGGIYLTSFPNCPPFTWNRFDAYYEPCVPCDLSSMVPRCQLQFIEHSCVPVFREPSSSSYYQRNWGFMVWYGDEKFQAARDWFECGSIDDEAQFLYVMCNNQTWYDSMRSRLCRFLGRESNCTFPSHESQDKKGVTCARSITYDNSIIGVLTQRAPNIDVLVKWDEYAPIMENPDLIYSDECRAIREPIEQEIREWDNDCPHYPHGAHPRKPHPVDWDHADCR